MALNLLTVVVLLAPVCVLAGNERPIIGIYAAPSSEYPGNDYVAASYVKWLESAGALVVPIPFHISNEHAVGNVSVLNGILFPGGGSSLPSNAQYLYDHAMELNRKGDYFPMWGSCLGFEWMIEMQGHGKLDQGFDAENITLPLTLTADAGKSRVFAEASNALMSIYSTQGVTMNNHVEGISPESFNANANLTSFFTVLSTNEDRRGRSFVSTVEAQDYPVYGTQWHPEKNQFEYGFQAGAGKQPLEVINHSWNAIQAGQYMANFFVNEARKSEHTYPSEAEEAAALVYNWPTKYSLTYQFMELYLL